MRPLRSYAYLTDIALTRFDGIVEDRGDHLLVRTPSNPSFYWGNYLLFPEPPTAASTETWLALVEREIPDRVVTLLTWDCPDGAVGDISGFLTRGFELDTSVTLTATAVTAPPKLDPDVAISPIAGDADWEAAAGVLVAAFSPRRSGTVEELAAFVHRQLVRYRRMQDARIGQWYLARVDGAPAATLGLVDAGDRVGRFQLVGTDPRFGRRGVCSSLVYGVAKRGLERFDTLVMAADATYHAAKVYESVGFRPTETLQAVMKKPPAA